MSGVRWALIPFSVLAAGTATYQLYPSVSQVTQNLFDAFFSATFFGLLSYIILYALTNRFYPEQKEAERLDQAKNVKHENDKKVKRRKK